jgi:uncharacterized protein YneF (UPF0154 family)
MSNPEKDDQWQDLSALGLIGSVGLVVAMAVLGGLLLGLFLERRIATGGLVVVVSILAGLILGIYGAYRLLSRELPWNR